MRRLLVLLVPLLVAAAVPAAGSGPRTVEFRYAAGDGAWVFTDAVTYEHAGVTALGHARIVATTGRVVVRLDDVVATVGSRVPVRVSDGQRSTPVCLPTGRDVAFPARPGRFFEVTILAGTPDSGHRCSSRAVAGTGRLSG